MTVDEKMIAAVEGLIARFGVGYEASRKELLKLLSEEYQVPEGSVIPTDYCYNRTNDGISNNKPMLFEYLSLGRYKCLGTGYPYNGPVYRRARGSSGDVAAGVCRGGVREEKGI